QLDHGVHSTSPLAVGESYDHDIGDAVVFGERALHLGRKDVGAAGDDHVAAAIGDVEITVGVDITDIACCAEPVGCRRQQRSAAQIEVSGAHRRAQINLAELTGTHRLAPRVQGVS